MSDIQDWEHNFYEKIHKVKRKYNWTLNIDNGIEHRKNGWQFFSQHGTYGRFHCSWCGHSWTSIHVVILFHMKLVHKRRQGMVKMRLLGQRCHMCDYKFFENPKFSENIRNSILENLVNAIRKQCYGERDVPELLELHDGQVMHGPHKYWLCEACILGICKMGSSFTSQEDSSFISSDVHIQMETGNISLPEDYDTIQKINRSNPIKQKRHICKKYCCWCIFLIALFIYMVYYVTKHLAVM